jgi:SMODS-associating 4TM effector domain
MTPGARFLAIIFLPTRTREVNEIPRLQNEDAQIKLLAARRLVYRRATILLLLQFSLVVVFPIAATIVGFVHADSRPLTAFLALTFTFVDILVTDRFYRGLLTQGAKLGEEFDCTVLGIPWESSISGSKVAREVLAETKGAAFREKPADLLNWYPAIVGTAVPWIARIICQRTNVWYDRKLRFAYSFVIGAICFLFVIVLSSWAIALQMTISDWVISVLSPLAPVIVWTAREVNRQIATCKLLESLRDRIEEVWELARSNRLKETKALSESRTLQNSIYLHRASAPLILPGLYHVLRGSLETQMNDGAADMVAALPETLRDA